jgi:glycosyltransferase involved in cell wall biosynthesis
MAITGTPVVYCPHGWAQAVQENKVIARLCGILEKYLAPITARIVAVSEFERKFGIQNGIPERKIVTIHNGIRPTPPPFQKADWNDTRLKALYVGRFDRVKGIDVLLKAVKDLEKCVSLRIAGEAVTDDQKLANESSHLTYLGWLKKEEVAAQMDACDVVILPSRFEALSMVALEALRLKKPLIATNVGGTPEIVQNGVNGYLFPKADAQALTALLQNADRQALTEMGERGGELFQKKFSAETMATKVAKLYAELCGKK